MTLILTTIALVLIIIQFIIFADVILSWLTLFGLQFRPYVISAILDPLYNAIKKRISTTIGPFELAPIIVLIGAEFLILFIYGLDIETYNYIQNISSVFT